MAENKAPMASQYQRGLMCNGTPQQIHFTPPQQQQNFLLQQQQLLAEQQRLQQLQQLLVGKQCLPPPQLNALSFQLNALSFQVQQLQQLLVVQRCLPPLQLADLSCRAQQLQQLLIGQQRLPPPQQKRQKPQKFSEVAKWEHNFQALKQFRAANPNKWPKREEKLGNWVDYQRASHKQGKLKEERIKKLDEIHFPWRVYQDRKKAEKERKEELEACQELLPFNRRLSSTMFCLLNVPPYIMATLLRVKSSIPEMCQKSGMSVTNTENNGKAVYMVDRGGVVSSRQSLRLEADKENRQSAIETLAKLVASKLPLDEEGYQYDAAFLYTKTETFQPPHRDFRGCGDLKKKEEKLLPYVAHCPLCSEGMWLNYWPKDEKEKKPLRIHIPFGTVLVARADAVHAGIFGNPGNARLHIAFKPLKTSMRSKGKGWKIEGSRVESLIEAFGFLDDGTERIRGLDWLAIAGSSAVDHEIDEYCDPEEGFRKFDLLTGRSAGPTQDYLDKLEKHVNSKKFEYMVQNLFV